MSSHNGVSEATVRAPPSVFTSFAVSQRSFSESSHALRRVVFAGAFLCNCVPHLVAGLQGMPFPSPFAKPHGVGDSPAVVNVLWGFFNLVVGLYLLLRHPIAIEFGPELLALLAGAFVLGVLTAIHFGKVWQSKHGR
jgi:hypothetical protein